MTGNDASDGPAHSRDKSADNNSVYVTGAEAPFDFR
jgi:hypothetical protein